jgi:hypothetical protein
MVGNKDDEEVEDVKEVEDSESAAGGSCLARNVAILGMFLGPLYTKANIWRRVWRREIVSGELGHFSLLNTRMLRLIQRSDIPWANFFQRSTNL